MKNAASLSKAHKKIIKLARGKDSGRLECSQWICRACNVVMDVSQETHGHRTWNFQCPGCKRWFWSLPSIRLKQQVQRFLLATTILGNAQEQSRAKVRLGQILGGLDIKNELTTVLAKSLPSVSVVKDLK